jgi:phosphoesterase RecJ-like protein
MGEPGTKGTAQDAAALIKESNNILIVSHMRPDGDCLGSTVALLMGLKTLGKTVAAYNSGPLGDRWDWLEGIGHVKQEQPSWELELTIFVDCGAVGRVTDGFAPRGTVLNIDHHLSNTCFGDLNWIDVDACAVGEQVYRILLELGVEINAVMASAIYTSIMSDSGGFRYPNTSDGAFMLAAKLVRLGADPGSIAQNVYENKTRGEAKLVGIAFATLRYEMDGAFAWTELRQEHYASAEVEDSEPEGLSSEIRGIKGVEISCLFHEAAEGGCRASFRGKGAIDCSAIARACGGGGHFNASGATIKGMAYDAARDMVLSQVRGAVQAWQNR